MDDSYAEVSDPAITVMFPIKSKKVSVVIVKNNA
jgi:hypothetical protein